MTVTQPGPDAPGRDATPTPRMVTTWTVHPGRRGRDHGPGAHHLERRRRHRRLLRAHLRARRACAGSTQAFLERLDRAVTDRLTARPRRFRAGTMAGDRRTRPPSTASPRSPTCVADGDVRRPVRRRPVHRLRHPRLPGRDRQPAPAHADDLPDLHPRPARPAPVLGAQLRRLAADPRRPGPTTGTGRSPTCRRPGLLGGVITQNVDGLHQAGGRAATSSSCTAAWTARSAWTAATSPTGRRSTSGCGRPTRRFGPRRRRGEPRRGRRAARRRCSTGS